MQEFREITTGQQKVKQHMNRSQKKNGRGKLNYNINGSQIGISLPKENNIAENTKSDQEVRTEKTNFLLS